MEVREEDVKAVKAYLNYIKHLDEKMKKHVLNHFLRRHVQDIRFDPFVSEAAVELLKQKEITSTTLKDITYNFDSPGDGVPEEIRPLFTDSAKGKENSVKIFHFEHHIPAGQAADELLKLDILANDIDDKIKKILAICKLCLITREEDEKLTNKSWKLNRPEDAYEKLNINIMTRSKACESIKAKLGR